LRLSTNWIKEIILSFTENPEVACVTGNTFPYHNNPKWACPPTISKKYQLFSKPIYHAHIGFGNNFAIRKSALQSIGMFKEWLGPGSVGLACEDGEMIVRLLTKGYKICHNPKMIVYHNKELSKKELPKQNLSYLYGEMACYGYYAFAGYPFARKIVISNFTQSVFDIKKIAGNILRRRIIKPDSWIYPCSVLCMRVRGLVIGLWYYGTERLFK
jgi:GT2 family glycosyltransferase